jgi:L-idonate 5-dehydrogenase
MIRALAATLYGPEDLRIVENELPPLAPGMVRIRFGAGGICGSDMHYFRHGRSGDFVVRDPLVLGHELAGEIIEINALDCRVSLGDRVAVNPSRWCGTCARCREGRHNICENPYFMGSASRYPHMQGGFASHFDVAPFQCVKLPPHMLMEAASFAEPVAVCLHAAARAGDLKGKRIVVFGAGPIGLLTVAVSRLAGITEAAVVDIADAPLAFAHIVGADHIVDISRGTEALTYLAGARVFDVAFEASGSPAGLAAAIGAVRRGGTVVQIGNLPGGDVMMPANAIMTKEIDLRGSFRFGKEFGAAVKLIADGKVDVLSLITARLPLSDAAAAMRLAFDRSRSMKVILTAK